MIPYSKTKRFDLYTLCQIKLLKNHTLHSSTYLYIPYIAVPSPLVQLLLFVGFFKIHLFVIFSKKNMTSCTPPNCLLSNTVHSFSITEDCLQKRFMHFNSSKYYFRIFEAKGTQIFSIFLPFTTSCVPMTKIGNVQNSG